MFVQVGWYQPGKLKANYSAIRNCKKRVHMISPRCVTSRQRHQFHYEMFIYFFLVPTYSHGRSMTVPRGLGCGGLTYNTSEYSSLEAVTTKNPTSRPRPHAPNPKTPEPEPYTLNHKTERPATNARSTQGNQKAIASSGGFSLRLLEAEELAFFGA